MANVKGRFQRQRLYIYHLGMVVEVLHNDKVLVYALIPAYTERGESTMTKSLHDDKAPIYALIPAKTERAKKTMTKSLHDDKVPVYALIPAKTERARTRP